MTKRTLAADVEALRDEVLEDLDPTKRVGLLLRGSAAGRDEWVDQLRESCPRDRYETYDIAYSNRMALATVWGYGARYALRLDIDHYCIAELQRQRDLALWMGDFGETGDFEEEFLAGPDNVLDSRLWLGKLACDYYGHGMFADEVLGITLREWLTGLPGDDGVVDSADEVLAAHQSSLDIGPGETADTDETIEVATHAESLFESLRETWRSLD